LSSFYLFLVRDVRVVIATPAADARVGAARVPSDSAIRADIATQNIAREAFCARRRSGLAGTKPKVCLSKAEARLRRQVDIGPNVRKCTD